MRNRIYVDKSGSKDFQYMCLCIVCIVNALQQKTRNTFVVEQVARREKQP